jgi:leukotriene-A4 hydrolase
LETAIKLTEICSQLTPTLLTGDRSAVSTVIHELAHSWFGNAITCRTWEHFWLNEGFTVWLERKIVARIHGEAHRDFDYLWHDMDSFKRSLKTFQSTPNALSLVTDLTLTDPDDYFSTIPYEKGSQFLYWLEKAIVQNSHLSFEGFVQSWIRQNVHKTVTSEEFQKFFESYYGKTKCVCKKFESLTMIV